MPSVILWVHFNTQTRGDGEETKKTGEDNFPESKLKSGVEHMENESIEDSKEASKDVKNKKDDTKIEIRKEEDDTSSKIKTGAEPMDEEKKDASTDEKVKPVAKI